MRKLLLIIFVLGMTGLMLLAVWTIMGRTESSTVPNLINRDVPVQQNISPEYGDNEIGLPDTGNNRMTVPNFLKDPSVVPDEYNDGYYYLGNTFTSGPNGGYPEFVIVYEEQSGFFNIALLKKPFTVSQYIAEEYMKEALSLQESQLCAIRYSVSVPGNVDDLASGTDYRFSFCADSIPIRE